MVLLALARRCNPDSRLSWPSIKDLTDLTLLSTRVIQLHIRALAERGVIAIIQGGGATSNRYSIVGFGDAVDDTPATDSTPVIDDTPAIDDRGDTDDTPAVHDTPPLLHMTGVDATHSTPPLLHTAPVIPIEYQANNKRNTNPPPARARERPDYGFEDYESFFEAIWAAGKWKVGKAKMHTLARDIEPPKWRDAVAAVSHYFESSTVLRGYIKRPDRWLQDGDWLDYIDGPVLDEPRYKNGNGHANGASLSTSVLPFPEIRASPSDAKAYANFSLQSEAQKVRRAYESKNGIKQ